MGKRNSARRRSRELVARRAAKAGLAISAPDLVAQLLRNDWRSFYDDKAVARDLIGLALSQIVRSIITRHLGQAGDDDPAPMQFELWPEDEQALAAQIGLMRAYVPSREAHVALYDANKITPDELEEAGQYLIGHGQGCINRGSALLLLAKRRRLPFGRRGPSARRSLSRRPPGFSPGAPASPPSP